MSWSISRFRAGELVEVRTKEEILATLDQDGRIAGMPFMPEMLQFCGRQVRVGAVAHKTCETAQMLYESRRLDRTVHLDGLRCDGSAHGGCQAECLLFWRDEWLKPVTGNAGAPVGAGAPNARLDGCSEEQLVRATRAVDSDDPGRTRYSCQATLVTSASRPLAWWNPRQYLLDVTTGNHSAAHTLRVVFLASLRWTLKRLPVGYRLFKAFHDRMHLALSGRGAPSWNGRIPDGQPTPTARLDLAPGELVRIRTQAEIETTINTKSRNRGLGFDPEEMAPYCGRVVPVHKAVTRIIEEHTGRMIQMKEPCIMLEGVLCRAESARCRLNCPRAIPPYWREIWLERVNAPTSVAGSDSLARPATPLPSPEPTAAPPVVNHGAAGISATISSGR